MEKILSHNWIGFPSSSWKKVSIFGVLIGATYNWSGLLRLVYPRCMSDEFLAIPSLQYSKARV